MHVWRENVPRNTPEEMKYPSSSHSPQSLAFLSRIFATLTLVGLWTGCGHSSPANAQDTAKAHSSARAATLPPSREADDVARFFAGLPGTPGSPFADLEQTEAWKTHRNMLDQAWHKAEGTLLAGLTNFEKQEFSADPISTAPVFYPFGGPDALTVTLLFPKSPVFTIVALEPAGTLPSTEKIHKMDLLKYLAETRETMASELGRSFFITREMDRQFRGQITDGLLLPIMQLLVRTHHKILAFRYVRFDDDAKIIERSVTYQAPTRYGNKGLEIEFQTEGDSSIHTLYYFSVNLANDRLAENKPFLTYLSSLKGVTTFFKATSYMTHKPLFSTIRNGVLTGSANIVQDDSGIPYSFYTPDTWKVQLYGQYDKPYGSFSWLEQPALRKAYADPSVKPLALRIGYGYAKVPSNLLWAKKK